MNSARVREIIENQDFVIDFSVFGKVLVSKGIKIIVLTAVISAILIALVLLFYKEKYAVHSLVMVDQEEQLSFVNDENRYKSFEKQDAKINPFKTQIELLNNASISESIFKRIQKAHPELIEKLKIKNGDELKNFIKVDQAKEAGLINVDVLANDPQLALELSNVLISEYQAELQRLTNKPLEQREKAITDRIEDINKQLQSAMQKLSAFQTTNKIIDIDLDASKSEDLMVNLLLDMSETERGIKQNELELTQFKQALKQDPQKAIRSLIAGESSRYKELDELRADYAQSQGLYTDNHPVMKLKRLKIASLEKQLGDLAVVSQPLSGNAVGNLISQYAQSDAKIAGLLGRQETNKKLYQELIAKLELLPSQRVLAGQLKQELDTLTQISDVLARSLADIRLKMSIPRVFVETSSDLPEKPEQPTKLVLALAIILVSALAIYTLVVIRDISRNNGRYQMYRLAQLLNVPFMRLPGSIRSQQKLIQFQKSVELYAMRLRKQKREHGFASVALLSAASTINDLLFLQGLAVSLGKVGDKVLLIDTDLKNQMMKYELARQIDFSESKPMDELMEAVTSRKTNTAVFNSIESNLYSLTPEGNVQFFDFAGTPEDLFSFMHSKGYQQIIEALKGQDYDWILCKSPALQTEADAFSVLANADAVIMITSKKANIREVSHSLESIYDLDNRVVGILSDEGAA